MTPDHASSPLSASAGRSVAPSDSRLVGEPCPEGKVAALCATSHLVILENGHNHRRALRFLTYFPRGLVGMSTASYTDELQVVRSLADR